MNVMLTINLDISDMLISRHHVQFPSDCINATDDWFFNESKQAQAAKKHGHSYVADGESSSTVIVV